MLNYRKIEPADDKRIAEIIRANLKSFIWISRERRILTPSWII